MKALFHLIVVMAISLSFSGCDKAADEPPPHGPLPGVDDRPEQPDESRHDIILEQFLASDVTRCIGTGTLSADSVGVMIITHRDGSMIFHHVDDGRTVTFGYTAVAPDSALTDASLTVNSTAVSVSDARLLKSDGTTHWYAIVAADSARTLICRPVIQK